MHAKLERLLSKSLTTLEVMAYYLVVHTGPGQQTHRCLCGRRLCMAEASGTEHSQDDDHVLAHCGVATRDVMVRPSAFLTCHHSFARVRFTVCLGLNFQAVVRGIF